LLSQVKFTKLKKFFKKKGWNVSKRKKITIIA
jgi:hypothetical protein